MKEFTNASMDFCDTDRQAIHFCIFTYRKAKAHGPFYNCLVILWLCLQWHHKEPEIPLSYWWKPFLLQIIWTWAPSLSTGSFPAHFYHLFFNSHSFPPCSSSAHLHPLSSLSVLPGSLGLCFLFQFSFPTSSPFPGSPQFSPQRYFHSVNFSSTSLSNP